MSDDAGKSRCAPPPPISRAPQNVQAQHYADLRVFTLGRCCARKKGARSVAAATLLKPLSLTTPTRNSQIIALMLENHSFDNMLGNLPQVNGVSPSSCNTQNATGKTYCATKNGAYSDPDPDHSVDATSWQLYGARNPPFPQDPAAVKMSGFIDSYSSASTPANAPTIMDCFEPSHVPIISTLAQTFTVLDTYHASIPGPTFPNRLFFFSATSHGFGDNDALQTALGWPQKSIFGSLNASQWRVYFSDVPSALLMADARGGLLTDNFRPITAFAGDAAKGDLPDFTLIEPAFMDIPGIPASDQHPAHDVRDGERLIKLVYEAVRGSPVWNESALLVTCAY